MAGTEVKGYEAFEQIDEHNQLPLDPIRRSAC